jgi:hypothetical protein
MRWDGVGWARMWRVWSLHGGAASGINAFYRKGKDTGKRDMSNV